MSLLLVLPFRFRLPLSIPWLELNRKVDLFLVPQLKPILSDTSLKVKQKRINF